MSSVKSGKYGARLPLVGAEGYVNQIGGWIDYLLAEEILFSHRTNDYTPDNFPEDLHAHDYFELTVCGGGEQMQYVADKRQLLIRPGTAVLSKPMAIHMFRACDAVRYDRYVLYFKSVPQIFADAALFDCLQKGDGICAFFGLAEERILSHLVKAEQALTEADSPYAATRALLHLCNVFLLLSESSPSDAEHIASATPEFVREIKEYIDGNFIHIRSVAELADIFFYSREHLTRSFHRYYNTPLYEYILRRKLVYCCSLLKDGMSVEQAAAEAGFHNHSSFVKAFRKIKGCTPSEYQAGCGPRKTE